MSSLAWYAGRAAAMSPREMMWRARRVGDSLARRDRSYEQTDSRMLASSMPDWDALLQGFRDGTARPVLLDQDRASRIAAEHPAEVKALIAEAERFLAGERAYFGYPSANIGAVVDWNYDPVTDYRWPAVAGSRIDHRVARSDPKWIWELNRLQHLPVLAQAWLFTGEPHTPRWRSITSIPGWSRTRSAPELRGGARSRRASGRSRWPSHCRDCGTRPR